MKLPKDHKEEARYFHQTGWIKLQVFKNKKKYNRKEKHPNNQDNSYIT